MGLSLNLVSPGLLIYHVFVITWKHCLHTYIVSMSDCLPCTSQVAKQLSTKAPTHTATNTF